jgi:Glyoxalase/Bleomycin resistance protein/Dioxygenase superfamily
MSRVQPSLNVSDPGAAAAFCTWLLGAPPVKPRPGYANFAIDDPPLKLALNAPGNGAARIINHLGVEVSTTQDVDRAQARPAAEGLPAEPETSATCCYARKGKVATRPRRAGLGVLHSPGTH